jgi:23S rRNA pseudouridine955/2504/2580 synthase
MLFYYEGKKKTKLKAITHFEVLDSTNSYSFIKLKPETGRKHQLRKQMLIHGFPILGDQKYNNNIYYNDKKKNRLMLHAYKINFSIDDNKYNFSADIPYEFNKIIKEKYLRNFL